MITAKVIADSVSVYTGTRITTMELEYPRFILAELNTHRTFSRNTASSRAIPIDRMIELVETNTAIPIHWGLNQSGMQAKHEQANTTLAINTWIDARNDAIKHAKKLQSLGLHKQIVNRVLEPFQMVKTLVTSTSYDNFFHLRLHKDAQPEIQQLALMMYEAMKESKPIQMSEGHWHLPYVTSIIDQNSHQHFYSDDRVTEIDLDTAIKISCSCSAQVSYRKTDTSIEKAKAIYDKLVTSQPVHASAFEHCATPICGKMQQGVTHIKAKPTETSKTICSGNFENWIQYRQLISNHDCKKYLHEQL